MSATSKVILGLNSAGFNTSSALVIDGELVFAVEEERIIREKRTRRFPTQGIRAALAHANLTLKDVDTIAVAWNPAINLEAHDEAQSGRHRYLGELFYSVPSQLMAMKPSPQASLTHQRIEFYDGTALNLVYVPHHLGHAASFFVSPFDDAAICSMDAFGEKHSVMFCRGSGTRLEVLWSQEFPHSPGSFYSAFTAFCGFTPKGDEWKLMGASAYGDPERFYPQVRSLVRMIDDGGFELDLACFNHYQFHRPGLFTPRLSALLGVQPNPLDAPLSQEHYDVAAAAQRVLEDIYTHLLRRLHLLTGLDQLVLTGGVALNCVANGKFRRLTPFRDLFVPPVPDDSGGALGAAYYIHCHLDGGRRSYLMRDNYLGPGYSDQQIEQTLQKFKIGYERVGNPAAYAAQRIAEGRIVGWFQGRLEFGDRALGNRSILADPRDPKMKDKVNETIKYREGFRPFAPAILAEHMNDYFLDATASPFMEKTYPIRPEKRAVIPAVTHVDGSGRLQTVTRQQNPRFYELIEHFHRHTGVPVVLNTSFNLKGDAVVCSPEDALDTFFSCGLDDLVLGSFAVQKDRP
jgi:carbamoyltransferase